MTGNHCGAKGKHTEAGLTTTDRKPNKESKPMKRKLSSTSIEEIFACGRPKKRARKRIVGSCLYQTFGDNFSRDVDTNRRLILEEKVSWSRAKSIVARYRHKAELNSATSSLKYNDAGTKSADKHSSENCWMDSLPQELLLKIFGYLPLGMLLYTIPQVCKQWEVLALDWTLWKAVENLTIKNMVISTTKLRSLLRTIPKLKQLELILRNDTEELLHELIKTNQNLEVLILDRCYRSTLQMNILSQTVTSVLEFCPKLKIVMLMDTYFHSKTFYKCLAKKFKNLERISVTCTTKSEMDIFIENLKENVSEVEFQSVPMMGRAEGKQIYWGPILGLVVRPIPTSPFHQQYTHSNYPTYAF
ncbi:hypothetical protein RUM43_007305 [Polyplax serrata]|uniref:F-box domain-containing protein n=1 Tax=Polyplax serrata TaxID=468196 RepID=A0AAN8P8C7_POLSC